MRTQSEVRQTNGTAKIEKLAEEFGHNAGSRLVFSEPVERNGVSVIPVAKVRYGFGSHNTRDGRRFGGGGGLKASPIGYIEVTAEGSKFHSIMDAATLARIVLGSLVVGLWVASKLSKH